MSIRRYSPRPIPQPVVAPSDDDEQPPLTDQHQQPTVENERPLPPPDDYLDPWAKPKPSVSAEYDTPDPDPDNEIPRFLRVDEPPAPPVTTRPFGWRPPKSRKRS